MSQSPSLRRHLLAALTGALLLLGVLVATAHAETYGGLGPLGAFTPGANGGHLEVNPEGHRAFGVDPADGTLYVADEIKVEGKHDLRIQKLGPKGEYLAETRVELTIPSYQLDGVAIDSARGQLYLLVVTEREGENEELEEELYEYEEKLELKKEALAKKREKGEPPAVIEKIEKEIKEFEAKIKTLEAELPVFDPYAPVAAELFAFSTEAKEGELKPAAGTKAGLLTDEEAFNPLSEEGGVPLLDPHGIAVDPVTHDVLILGQQDESTKKGEEDLHAAVQRIHTEGPTEGELGPRYVDKENCLDEGPDITAEPACSEGFSGQPSSPFVSPGGRMYGERSGELWEIPATEGESEAFESRPTVYEARPKRLFTVGQEEGIEGEEGIVEPISEEEGAGGASAFVPTSPGEGKIYLDAHITAEEGGGNKSENRGAVVLDYNESGAMPEARELGWTAGQNSTGENEKCVLPLGGRQTLVGADSGGRLLLFDVTPEVAYEHKLATVNVLQFGAGGEECGHARTTPPSVSVLGEPVTKLPKGKTALLSLDVFAADALSVEWRFEDNDKQEADEPPVMESYPFPTQVPTLTHEFKHGGSYEVIASVEPDDFGPKIEEHSDVTVEGGEEGGSGGVAIGTEFSYTSPATVGQSARFSAKVTDPNNRALPGARYRYVWEFGDGARMEGSGDREFKAEHVYSSEGRYEVKLEVTDEAGRTTDETHVVQVNVPRTPAIAPSSGGAGGGDSGGGAGAGGSGAPGVTSAHVPDATLAETSLAVSRFGEVALKLACPAGETSCSGTVTLRTLGAVKASTHGKKQVITLAAGSFTVVGGHVKAVTLHLSAKARTLLARSHVLRAQTTLLAHDSAGAIDTTQTIVTLRLAKPSHRRAARVN